MKPTQRARGGQQMNPGPKRIIVCGGRDFDHKPSIIKAFQGVPTGSTIVHGDCSGADRMAAKYAAWLGLTVEPHPPDKKEHGSPQAFHIRNQEMADLGADYLIAFPGGAGTANMIERAEKAGIPVRKIAKPKEPRDAG